MLFRLDYKFRIQNKAFLTFILSSDISEKPFFLELVANFSFQIFTRCITFLVLSVLNLSHFERAAFSIGYGFLVCSVLVLFGVLVTQINKLYDSSQIG